MCKNKYCPIYKACDKHKDQVNLCSEALGEEVEIADVDDSLKLDKEIKSIENSDFLSDD